MAGRLTITTGRRRSSADAGFTLVELLVVIAILSVLSVGAVLVAGRRDTAAGADAAAFRLAHDRVRGLAIAGQGIRGILVGTDGRRLAERQGTDWRFGGPELPWRGRVRLLSVERERGRPASRQIVFYPDGRTSAFRLVFEGGGERVDCQSDGWTGLRCTSS